MTDDMTPQQAAQLVEADKQRRVQAVAQAIQDVLQQHTCDLAATPQITADGRIVAIVQIVAR